MNNRKLFDSHDYEYKVRPFSKPEHFLYTYNNTHTIYSFAAAAAATAAMVAMHLWQRDPINYYQICKLI